MGARWRAFCFKAPQRLHGGCEVANGAHAGFRQSYACGPQGFSDGRNVSFVRDHNSWLVNLARRQRARVHAGWDRRDSQRRTRLGVSRRTRHQDRVLVSPDSSAIAYLEMDERKVSQYPLVDFSSPSGEAEMERYPTAGGANPIVRVFVAVAKRRRTSRDGHWNGDRHLHSSGELAHGLQASRHSAPQSHATALDLLIANSTTGKTRTVLSEMTPIGSTLATIFIFSRRQALPVVQRAQRVSPPCICMTSKANNLRSSPRVSGKSRRLKAVDEAQGLVYFSARKNPRWNATSTVSPRRKRLRPAEQGEGTHAAVLAPHAGVFYDTYSNAATPPRQELYRADGSHIATVNENKITELRRLPISLPWNFSP